MKKFILVLTVVSALFLAGCAQQSSEENNEELVVGATIFPVADIAEQIAGNNARVVQLLPAGASPHTFDFSPSDVKLVSESDVLFSIGYSLDDWASEIVEAADEDIEIVTVDGGIDLKEFEGGHGHDHEEEAHEDEHEDDEHGHVHEGVDPHYWLDPNNGMFIAENIANTLVELDPANSEIYLKNLEDYQKELRNLDSELESIFSEFEDPELMVFHDSWAYFADRYDLEVVGIFEPSPGKEPTPRYLEELYEAAEEHGITVVFSEPQLATSSLDPFIEDLGLSIFTLDPLGGIDTRDSYINLLRYNAETIAEAIQ